MFDKAGLELTQQISRSIQMADLGSQNAERADFADASDAFKQAAASLHELHGMPMEDIPKECRYVPLALSDSLFGQKKFAESAAAVEDGLNYFPDLAAH